MRVMYRVSFSGAGSFVIVAIISVFGQRIQARCGFPEEAKLTSRVSPRFVALPCFYDCQSPSLLVDQIQIRVS